MNYILFVSISLEQLKKLHTMHAIGIFLFSKDNIVYGNMKYRKVKQETTSYLIYKSNAHVKKRTIYLFVREKKLAINLPYSILAYYSQCMTMDDQS